MWSTDRKHKLVTKDTIVTNKITLAECENYFRNFFEKNNRLEQHRIITETGEEDKYIDLTDENIKPVTVSQKNRNTPVPDNILNKVLKYGGNGQVTDKCIRIPNLKKVIKLYQKVIVESYY